jgi:hypothetical protein
MDENEDIPEIVVVDTRTNQTVAVAGPGGAADDEEAHSEAVERPAKVLRIGSMIKQLLDEVRLAPLDDASRTRLKEIYETSLAELRGTLSPELAAELNRMTLPLDSPSPSDAELRIAQAQLVGWLEGLFHGIQATLFAQQMAARSQLEEMSRRGLPAANESSAGQGRTGYL